MSDNDLSREHENAFIMAFVLPERRHRYILKLNSAKTRAKFLNRLNHRFLRDLDARYIVERPVFYEPLSIASCYIIADESQFDGKLVTLTVAQEFLDAATFGIVVSYLPGKLVAYKDESPSKILWLARSRSELCI